MSLRMHLGRRGSLLVDRPTGLRLVRLEHPVLLEAEMAALWDVAGVQAVTLPALWNPNGGPEALRIALDQLCRAAGRAAGHGACILVLSDHHADRDHPPIPMALAVGAVHQHLLRKGLRTRVGLVAAAGDAWDVHHFAALIGYGAEAVHPWLALVSVQALCPGGEGQMKFRAAAEKGLLKVLSKMGISTLSSYCGAQIFEALGLGAEVVDRCFTGTVSTIGGIGFAEIAEDILARQRAAYPSEPAAAEPAPLPDRGRVRYRRDGEDHGWSPPLVRSMQEAITQGTAQAYGAFLARVLARPPASPRDLLTIRTGTPIPLDEVEPAEAIRRRFVSTAMSLGALSPEAHRTLAIGMNRMGARSNCGEGGEDPDSYAPLPRGDRADNRIKQVASGRFGVTTQYLVRADELEIKMAQGSKPGEGGQLPGHKVTALIARLRHSVPGVPLISPPPHHDIYSIEDLAQLIHDLKAVNRRARIGVKLVAEAGVGTIAAGVAKARADYILISGHSGGTGASPLSSIKSAGVPWELGLAETQQVLTAHDLRERVSLRTDGGLRSGRDIVVAAMLGAEEFGFGTGVLVALGCDMARQCHLNTCPTGIATQNEELRAKFEGRPEHVVNYLFLIAEEVREHLAKLGSRTLDEIVGRVELLEQDEQSKLDLSYVLATTDVTVARRRQWERNGESPTAAPPEGEIDNSQRTTGANLSRGERRRYRGSAGQSFGAFLDEDVELTLEGQAQDYVGKGMGGGVIAIQPFAEDAAAEPVLAGNTIAYGATGGRLFIAGRVGERFCVRNSGAVAVVEGAGDHFCEYMTGGVAVSLGQVGWNAGAGMTGGTAYAVQWRQLNADSVVAREVPAEDAPQLRALVEEHHRRTGSKIAASMLAGWE